MKGRINLFICALGFLISASTSSALEESMNKNDLSSLLHKANEAFQQGSYQEAIDGYQTLLANVENGELHYNIGNAFFRVGELGTAIYHFRKAALFLPRDADIRYNLAYARSKVTDQVEGSANLLYKAWSYLSFMNLREAYFFFIFAIGIAGTAFLLRKREGSLWLRRSCGLLFVLAVLIFIHAHFENAKKFGVVNAVEAKIYSGVGRDNVVLFTLHAGTEFDINDQADGWVQIELSDGKKGWIAAHDVIL